MSNHIDYEHRQSRQRVKHLKVEGCLILKSYNPTVILQEVTGSAKISLKMYLWIHVNIPGTEKSRAAAVHMFNNSWHFCTFWSRNETIENPSASYLHPKFWVQPAVLQYGVTVLKIILVLKKDSNTYSALSLSHSETHGTSQDVFRTVLELKHTHTSLWCNITHKINTANPFRSCTAISPCSFFSPLLWKWFFFFLFLCHSFLIFLIRMLGMNWVTLNLAASSCLPGKHQLYRG